MALSSIFILFVIFLRAHLFCRLHFISVAVSKVFFETRGRKELNTTDMSYQTVHFIMLFCTLSFDLSFSTVLCVFSIKSTWKGSEFRFIIYGIFSCFFFHSLASIAQENLSVTRYLNIINALFSFCVFYFDFFLCLQSSIARAFFCRNEIYVRCDFNLW